MTGTARGAAGSGSDEAARTFAGFERDGRPVGVRNRVLVLPSVICSKLVAETIAERVDRAVGAAHDHGCGQIGDDKAQTKRTFVNVAANPNVAGTVVVGLGCESIQSDEVVDELADRGLPVRRTTIQEAGGTDPCIEVGVEAAEELAGSAAGGGRTTGTLSDLTVGIVASDLESTTVSEVDPLLGAAAREIVEAGGRVVVAGTERLPPAADAIRDLVEPAALEEYDALVERLRRTPARTDRVRRQAGERSAEQLARAWDSLPLEGIVPYGARADHDEGVAFVDSPSEFAEAATGLAAAGAQVVLHATADGVPTGHPIVPVIKLTGDERTARALSEDVDVYAPETSAADLLARLRRVADGEPSRAERHGLSEFAITRVGPSM